MNAEEFCGARLVSIRPFQNAFNKPLLKFADGFIEQDATLYHLPDKPFQLISHVRTPHR